MSKEVYLVGPGIDPNAMAEYRGLLEKAYDNGAARGGSMDWADVQAALAKAVEALGGDAKSFMDDAEAGDIDPDATVRIEFAEGSEITSEAWSAALLLIAYVIPDSVKWEDVDSAWEALSVQTEAAMKP